MINGKGTRPFLSRVTTRIGIGGYFSLFLLGMIIDAAVFCVLVLVIKNSSEFFCLSDKPPVAVLVVM
jgi:hypothetical protein